MLRMTQRGLLFLFVMSPLELGTPAIAQTTNLIGKEMAVPVHLQDGQEFETSVEHLISFGQTLFLARWTSQEGQGRPFTKVQGIRCPIRAYRWSFLATSTAFRGPILTPASAVTIRPSPALAVIALAKYLCWGSVLTLSISII